VAKTQQPSELAVLARALKHVESPLFLREKAFSEHVEKARELHHVESPLFLREKAFSAHKVRALGDVESPLFQKERAFSEHVHAVALLDGYHSDPLFLELEQVSRR
jgi:hypothetical protein